MSRKPSRVAWNDPTFTQAEKLSEANDIAKARRRRLGPGREPQAHWQFAPPPGMAPGQKVTKKVRKNDTRKRGSQNSPSAKNP